VKWMVFAVLISLLCGETAYILVQRASNGSGTPWEKLSPPPEQAEQIVWLTGDRVVVETASHTFYSCSLSGGKCWESVGQEEFQPYFGGEPWQPSSELAPPPLSKIKDVKYVLDPASADYAVFAAYAIQNDGTVLAWRWGSGVISSVFEILSPLCAAGVALFASLILGSIVTLRSRKRPTTRRPTAAPLARS
jgi:hypothetical protein